jgi:hypothetical protein
MSHLAEGYADAGFTLRSVKPIDAASLTLWPTTWAKRLGHGRPRTFFQLEAIASAAR